MITLYSDFNPRSHERSDFFCEVAYMINNISIHAPTRGATQGKLISAFCGDFNPRSHERSDHTCCRDCALSFISIHAPTRGATRPLLKDSFQAYPISIHAPTRGATEHQLRLCAYRKFQSTLPREERHELPQLGGVNSQFQSTLPREERQLEIFSLQR